MGKCVDLTGSKVGRLTVISRGSTSKNGHVKWNCKCERGALTEVFGTNLKRNHTLSCVCLRDENRQTHGKSNTVLHGIWAGMKRRCNNKNSPSYKDYGGRGIKVCESWDNSAEYFMDWAETKYEEGLSLDRIDNDKGYYPDNCRFTTPSVQASNQRKRCDNTSGYVGVSKKDWGFRARINWKKKAKMIGVFSTPEEAVIARNDFIKKHNLPHPIQEVM